MQKICILVHITEIIYTSYMAIKVKINIDLKRQLEAAQSRSSRQIKKEIIDEIQKNYDKGISPVKGFNKFKSYAPSVAKRKGRKDPVTIEQSGLLRKSLVAVQKSKKSISIFFRGKRNEKLATWINFGTVNMDARPLLPAAKGQTFKKRITDKFDKIISKALNKFVK